MSVVVVTVQLMPVEVGYAVIGELRAHGDPAPAPSTVGLLRVEAA